MASYAPDGCVAGLRLGKLRNRVVPEIMEAQARQRASDLAKIGFAFVVPTSVGWKLLFSTFRTPNRAGQSPPCGTPATLRL